MNGFISLREIPPNDNCCGKALNTATATVLKQCPAKLTGNALNGRAIAF